MKVLGSWARKGTDEYRNFTKNGGGPIEYLADHGKRAGVDKEIAWQCSKDFLLGRYPNADVNAIQAGFNFYYDMAEKNPRYRKACFE